MALDAHWKALTELRESFEKLKTKSGISSAIIDKFLPSKAELKRVLTCVVVDLEPGWEARAGVAYAIWMGRSADKGYMDEYKLPVGSAGARLFESAAAATRTAKAAKFGADGVRGPAAIVRLVIEPVEVLMAESSKGNTPRQAIAELEAAEIEAALEEASSEDIAEALGESPAPMLPAPNIGRAGRQEGFACWSENLLWSSDHKGTSQLSTQGFVNIRGDLGPLTSAVLAVDAHQARSKNWGDGCVVKVALRPVEIVEILGQPEILGLESCIAWEAESARRTALAKQTGEVLRARAAALLSGAASRKARSNRL